MEFFQVLLQELSEVERYHPVLADAHPELTNAVFPSLEGDFGAFPCLYYGQEDGRIACYFRSFPDVSIYRGSQQTWSWNADLFTHPDFRRRGLAQSLVEQQMQACDRLGMIWGGVFSSPPALRLYEKLGFTMVGMAPRLCMIRNITPFLNCHMPAPVARVGNAVYRGADQVRRAYFSLRPISDAFGLLEEISPEAFADLPIPQNCDHDVLHWDRDADWVLRRQVVRGIDRFFVLKDTPAGSPLAYATIRQRENTKRPIREKYFGVNVMTLTHFGSFAPVEVTAPRLTAALVQMFRQSDADLLEIIASNPVIDAAARQWGFISLGTGMSFKFYAPPALRQTLPAQGLENFHLSHYAGDAFSFE